MTHMTSRTETDPRALETAPQDFASQWRLIWIAFRRHRLAMTGATIVLLLYVIAAFTEFLAPYDPNATSASDVYHPPQMIRFIDSEPDGGWFPKQKLTIEEAIQAYTLNSAYASFEEEIKGSIAVGKLADMAVLSDNLLEIEPKKIKDVENVITILGGKVIYQKR